GVRRREHDPSAEAVVQLPAADLRALREAGRQQLLVGKTRGARCDQHAVPRTGRVADSELPQDLLVQAAGAEVLACGRCLAGLPQIARVVAAGSTEQRVETLATLAALCGDGVFGLGLELHPEPVGERLQGR